MYNTSDQHTKIIKVDEITSIKMNIWDTAGQENFFLLQGNFI